MGYRYVIIDDGYEVTLTNSLRFALEHSDCDNFTVVDIETGMYLRDGWPDSACCAHKEGE